MGESLMWAAFFLVAMMVFSVLAAITAIMGYSDAALNFVFAGIGSMLGLGMMIAMGEGRQ